MRYKYLSILIPSLFTIQSFAQQTDVTVGEKLIAKSDCAACHKDKFKLIGPSYADIAAKYPQTPKNIALLSEKIIKGGKGVWGSIPMSEHKDISKKDAAEMVKYILSIKK
ncbi:c-type cytochrome [Pseudopedobacter beijingensis]|uniref:C-type cytochrome n=1 Tax=Pseudopedobacter beijingensis TaxID=1207056 RepID=A0ABW4IAQ6_9SPHI